MRYRSVAAVALCLILVGCTAISPQNANQKDQAVSANILDGYQKSQPVPVMDWSQLRQNLIEIETAQAKTTQTTSFFFTQGVADPILSCPSIGFPIPATYQLTNPEQVIRDPGQTGGGNAVTAQIEANGVFTADTTGTYAMCVNGSGKAYAFYWEGFVGTVTGPATWNKESRQIQLTGDPSVAFTTKR